MKDKYVAAHVGQTSFYCPTCSVFSMQKWGEIFSRQVNTLGGSSTYFPIKDFRVSICAHCHGVAIWKDSQMVFPEGNSVAEPHTDMPELLKADFNEAVAIFSKSPRGAAALLRLVIQNLMIELGEKGKIINDDIKALVSKGLSVKIQKALDYCRVVGNNAVHPGEISIDDTPEIAEALFKMINFIVEEMISKPKEIDALYNFLPESAREAIEKRDKKIDEEK